MSLLSNLSSDQSIADESDFIASSGPLESAIYDAKIAMAYVTKSAGGAMGLVLTLKVNGRDVKQTLWMTSGTAKGGKNYYEKDGQKHYLPGFNHANSLALLTVGKEISSLDTETKVVKVYSPEAKAEVPTKVECLVDLLDKDVAVGLIKQIVPKQVKNPTGVYVPTGESREENEIDKLFRARDRMTTAEIRAQATEAAFADAWDAKWTGKTKDRMKGVTAVAGAAGAPMGAGAGMSQSSKPTTSLFA